MGWEGGAAWRSAAFYQKKNHLFPLKRLQDTHINLIWILNCLGEQLSTRESYKHSHTHEGRRTKGPHPASIQSKVIKSNIKSAAAWFNYRQWRLNENTAWEFSFSDQLEVRHWIIHKQIIKMVDAPRPQEQSESKPIQQTSFRIAAILFQKLLGLSLLR